MSCNRDFWNLAALSAQIFTNCHRVVQQIKCYGQRGNPVEQKLAHNVLMSVARTLQDLSTEFRQSQSTYLRSTSTFCCCSTTGGSRFCACCHVPQLRAVADFLLLFNDWWQQVLCLLSCSPVKVCGRLSVVVRRLVAAGFVLFVLFPVKGCGRLSVVVQRLVAAGFVLVLFPS